MRLRISRLVANTRTSQTINQPIACVSAGDVERIVRRDFPKEHVNPVMETLGNYARESGSRELAQGDLESLQKWISAATRDYRDVLAAAEYPQCIQRGMFALRELPAKEKQQIIDNDWKQYQEWLLK
jgi:hypothetical protein